MTKICKHDWDTYGKCVSCGKWNKLDRPEYGKQYSLTGKVSIAAGNSWKESEVKDKMTYGRALILMSEAIEAWEEGEGKNKEMAEALNLLIEMCNELVDLSR